MLINFKYVSVCIRAIQRIDSEKMAWIMIRIKDPHTGRLFCIRRTLDSALVKKGKREEPGFKAAISGGFDKKCYTCEHPGAKSNTRNFCEEKVFEFYCGNTKVNAGEIVQIVNLQRENKLAYKLLYYLATREYKNIQKEGRARENTGQ